MIIVDVNPEFREFIKSYEEIHTYTYIMMVTKQLYFIFVKIHNDGNKITLFYNVAYVKLSRS